MLQSLGTTYVSVQLSTQYRSASWSSAETSWVPVCVHCLLSWHWAQQLKRAWLHPLCTFPSSIYRHWWDPAKPPLLQAVGCTALSVSSHWRGAPGPSSFSLQHTQDSLTLGDQHCTQQSSYGLIFLNLLATFFLRQPRTTSRLHHNPCSEELFLVFKKAVLIFCCLIQ